MRFIKLNMIKLFYIDLFFILFTGYLIDIFKIPSFIKFIPDFINCIFFLYLLKRKNIGIVKKRNLTNFFIIFFIIWTSITTVLNMTSPILFIWEARSFFRIFLFYYISLLILEKKEQEKLYKLLLKLHTVNILISLYQYFILGINQDNLGGIFGISAGVNSFTNIYFCLITILVLIKFLRKQEKFLTLVWILLSCLGVAALAEIKIFFIEFLLIMLLVNFLLKPNIRTVKVIVVGLISIVLGMIILKFVFPIHYEILMNISKLKEYSDMHGGGYGVSRFHIIRDINEFFFFGDYIKNIFGLGLGNCTMSSNSKLLTSNFYLKYSEYNYNWFSHVMIYLQTGIVGLILYLGIVFSFIYGAFFKKRFYVEKEYLIVYSVIVFINIFYNHCIRVETGYLLFLGFIFGLNKDYIKEIN